MTHPLDPPTMALWYIYRSVMYLKKRKKELQNRPVLFVVAYLYVAVAFLLDVLYNWFVGTYNFKDFPREFTFTSRLKRYKKQLQGWRKNEAEWLCSNYLNPYDAEHC